MIQFNLNREIQLRPALPQRQIAQKPEIRRESQGDTVQFGERRKRESSPASPRYEPQLRVGTYGVPQGHSHEKYFRADRPVSNPPGVVRVARIRSLDPDEKNPAKAYASEVTIDLRGTALAGKTTPGEHFSFLDTNDPNVFPETFRQAIKSDGPKYQFSAEDLEKLKTARIKNFSVASPVGGERNRFGKPTGKIKLLVRRVETPTHKGPFTNFLVSRKRGDSLVLATPLSHHFVGPKAQTPALFLGVGSSIAPYLGMLRTRFEQETGPYAETYLGIGHTRQGVEYYGKKLRKFARKENHHFTYRPVFSREAEKSEGIPYVQALIQNRDDARKIFSLILNPKSQIYISGFCGFEEQLLEALKKSTHQNPDLGVTETRLMKAIEKARQEDRFHVEGDIRKDMAEGLQGY